MRGFGRFLFASSLVIGLATQSGIASAASLTDSDRMVVLSSAGVVLFDATTSDLPPGEGSLTYGAPLPVGGLPPGTIAVVLTEPAGAPLDGIPPLYLPGTNLIVSDLVFSTYASAVYPGGVTLVSDSDPLLPQLLALLTTIPFHTVEETGGLQDISAGLGIPASSGSVLVQSDVQPVPEPGTLLLLGCGLAVIAAIRGRALLA